VCGYGRTLGSAVVARGKKMRWWAGLQDPQCWARGGEGEWNFLRMRGVECRLLSFGGAARCLGRWWGSKGRKVKRDNSRREATAATPTQRQQARNPQHTRAAVGGVAAGAHGPGSRTNSSTRPAASRSGSRLQHQWGNQSTTLRIQSTSTTGTSLARRDLSSNPCSIFMTCLAISSPDRGRVCTCPYIPKPAIHKTRKNTAPDQTSCCCSLSQPP